MSRRLSWLAWLALGLVLVLALLFPNRSDARGGVGSGGGSGEGRWIDVGHGPCGENRICADWYTFPDAIPTATCCLSTGLVGSYDYSSCTDFREPHATGDISQHTAEP
ncbi:MAG: hypothetical protein KDD47_27265 [Acidobacteria bacterium]|nr:hypothetical protein [Acidobacteriota bacterium]